MQDAEAAAIGFEIAFGQRADVEDQTAIGGAFDGGAEAEPTCVRPGAACRIADRECVCALVDDKVCQFGLVGAPVAVAHDIGDGAQHFSAAMADGAQIAVDEIGAEHARTQPDRLSFDRVRAIEQ